MLQLLSVMFARVFPADVRTRVCLEEAFAADARTHVPG
jgi:hypothetical protein